MKIWIKAGWVVSLSCALALFGVLLSLTPITHGLGINVNEGGRFFLKQGLVEMEIPQWFGWMLFVITYLFGFLIIAAIALGVPVFLDRGTLRITEILDEEDPREHSLLTVFRAACVIVSVGFAISAFSLFLRFAGR